MIAELDRRINELRFIEGIEKVEHVPYVGGDQFWVRFDQPFDLSKLRGIVEKHGYVIVPFAGLPSKLPRGLAELLWDGVTHVIAKKISGWSRVTSQLGFEPEGIAKLAVDLHGPYRIFMALDEQGIQLLYEYLGAKYVPPAPPPPKPTVPPSKPAAPAATRSVAPGPAPPAPTPSPLTQPGQAKPATVQVASPTTSSSGSTQPAAKNEVKKEAPAEA